MINCPDDMWVKLMRGKYFFNLNPLTDSVSDNGSWVWKGICEGLETIRKHACWEVGDGNHIHIWKIRWIPSIPTTVDSRVSSTNMKYVSQLIDYDTKTWKIDVLHAIFDDDTVNKITDIRIPMQGSDHIRWQPSSNDEFSVKTSYKAILNDANAENGFIPNTLVNWKVFWKKKIPQSILHFLWKCISNCLPTNDRLSRYCNHFSTLCPHCNTFDGSMQYLFIECDFC